MEESGLFPVLPERELEQQEAVDQVMLRVQGRTDLEETVVAICESSGDARMNQELADDLGITVSEVVNRKKRIRRSGPNHTSRAKLLLCSHCARTYLIGTSFIRAMSR